MLHARCSAVLARLAPAIALSLAAGPVCAQDVPLVSIDNTAAMATKLAIIIAVLVFVFFAGRRLPLSQTLRTIGLWILIFAAVIALYTFRGPLESVGREMVSVLMPGTVVSTGQSVMVRRAYQGHFVLDGSVDGSPVSFLFDTGASTVVLTAADAQRAGFHPQDLDYRVPVMTAAGMTEVAPVWLGDITIGDIRVDNVRAAVARADDLDYSLLGMTFLNRLEGYQVSRDRLVLNP